MTNQDRLEEKADGETPTDTKEIGRGIDTNLSEPADETEKETGKKIGERGPGRK